MSEEATLDEFADPPDRDDPQEQVTNRFWGEIPEDWQLKDGSEVYEVNPNPKPTEEPNTYIEMDALDTELPWPKYFGTRNASEYSGKTFTKGDTLFARITPCTENGKAALVPEMETEVGIGSTEYAVLSPNRDSINPWLLYYFGKSYPVHNYAISRMRGSTGRQRVPFSVFRRELDVALPPLPEQRKIATVLYTVDRAIDKTKEIIKQTERLKQGAMQDLFSRGVRGYDDFQETKYGSIPSSWDINTIHEISDRIGSGGTPNTDKEEYYDGGIEWVKTDDLNSGLVESTKTTITSQGLDESATKLFPEGTVVFAMYGGALGQNGRLGMEAAMNQACCGIVTDESEMNSYLLHQQLIHRKKQLTALSAGTHQQNISQSMIEKFEVFVPPLDEQKEMVDILQSIESTIQTNTAEKERLKRLKRGLMQDLLSGTVRTTDTNIQVPDEIAQHG